MFDGVKERNYPKIARNYINVHINGRYIRENETKAHVSATPPSNTL